MWKVIVFLFVCYYELKFLNLLEVFIFFFVGCGVRLVVLLFLRNVEIKKLIVWKNVEEN